MVSAPPRPIPGWWRTIVCEVATPNKLILLELLGNSKQQWECVSGLAKASGYSVAATRVAIQSLRYHGLIETKLERSPSPRLLVTITQFGICVDSALNRSFQGAGWARPDPATK